jgi:hypothetical protein
MRNADPVLVAVLEAAREAGSPVAGWTHSEREEIAKLAARRWRSFGRRHGGVGSFDARVEDLAKGLSGRLEEHERPLMSDYRWLAQQLAEALRNAA